MSTTFAKSLPRRILQGSRSNSLPLAFLSPTELQHRSFHVTSFCPQEIDETQSRHSGWKNWRVQTVQLGRKGLKHTPAPFYSTIGPYLRVRKVNDFTRHRTLPPDLENLPSHHKLGLEFRPKERQLHDNIITQLVYFRRAQAGIPADYPITADKEVEYSSFLSGYSGFLRDSLKNPSSWNSASKLHVVGIHEIPEGTPLPADLRMDEWELTGPTGTFKTYNVYGSKETEVHALAQQIFDFTFKVGTVLSPKEYADKILPSEENNGLFENFGQFKLLADKYEPQYREMMKERQVRWTKSGLYPLGVKPTVLV